MKRNTGAEMNRDSFIKWYRTTHHHRLEQAQGDCINQGKFDGVTEKTSPCSDEVCDDCRQCNICECVCSQSFKYWLLGGNLQVWGCQLDDGRVAVWYPSTSAGAVFNNDDTAVFAVFGDGDDEWSNPLVLEPCPTIPDANDKLAALLDGSLPAFSKWLQCTNGGDCYCFGYELNNGLVATWWDGVGNDDIESSPPMFQVLPSYAVYEIEGVWAYEPLVKWSCPTLLDAIDMLRTVVAMTFDKWDLGGGCHCYGCELPDGRVATWWDGAGSDEPVFMVWRNEIELDSGEGQPMVVEPCTDLDFATQLLWNEVSNA
ncbi:MAG: hypothetical protein Unbinned2514contig1000_1 [Prokaryotic dsDNA virus sp.]|nr:MAG: hypothetical protein Unbinned2514contig1000_1 [Prokaryotic dsDNA virus sp.]